MSQLDFGLRITGDGRSAVVETERVIKVVEGVGAAAEVAAAAAARMQVAVEQAGRRAADDAGFRLAAAQQQDLAEQTRRRAVAADAAAQSSARLAATLRAEAQASAGRSFDSRGASSYADAIGKVNAESSRAAAAALVLQRATAEANAALARGQITQAQHAAALREMTAAGQPAAQASESVASGLGKIGAAAVGLLGVDRIRAMGAALVEAELGSQKLQRQLDFGAGSRTAGAAELEYIKRVAGDLGLEFNGAAAAYAKFSAAAKGSAIEGDGARKVFEAVAKASTVMSLSADDSQGIFLALSQMLAKGKVSAEEFRGQLGERLPIATQVAAQALGVTTAEFSKMLDTGQLIADDFLPKFAAALDKAVGPQAQEAAGALGARINRLASEWELLKRAVADQAAGSGRRSFLDDLSRAVGAVRELFTDDAWVSKQREAANVQRDLAAGLDRLAAAGVKADQAFVDGLKGAYALGRVSAKEAVEAFAAYEKRLVELAASGKAKIEGLTADQAKAQTKLVEQITREQERRTLSATDFAIAEAKREAGARRNEADGNAGLLELIESELQVKIKAIRDQAEADRSAAEKKAADDAAAAAAKRLDLEEKTAGQVKNAWQAANAAKAGEPVIANAGTPGQFASSWDAYGNYVGDLGKSVAGLAALGNAYSASGRKLSIPEEIAMRNGYRFAAGGPVRGPGSATSDSILARLSHGEYVIRAESAARVGTRVLDSINRMGSLPRFAEGGPVMAPRSAAAPSVGSIEIHLHGVGGDIEALGAQIRQRLRTDPAWLTNGLRRPV